MVEHVVTCDRVVPFDQTMTVIHRLGKIYKDLFFWRSKQGR